MTRKAMLVTLALALGVAGLVTTAALAITGGEIDTVHKNVGLGRSRRRTAGFAAPPR